MALKTIYLTISQKLIFPAQTLPLSYTHIELPPLDSSFWKFNRHLIFNMFIPTPPGTGDSILLRDHDKNFGVILS